MKDELGDRFKAIEHEWRTTLPKRCFHVIRVDGRAFHTLTRGLDRPFDAGFTDAMDATAKALCEEISGTVCAYVQSDEISIIATDLGGEKTEPWFGGVLQKVVSVSAAVATAAFNENFVAPDRGLVRRPPARFDSRVIPLPDVPAVADYIWWRQADAQRNAISMLSHEYIGKGAVKGMGTKDRVAALVDAGVVISGFPSRCMNGGFFVPEMRHMEKWIPRPDGEKGTVLVEFDRNEWVCKSFSRGRNWFYDTYIDVYPTEES